MKKINFPHHNIYTRLAPSKIHGVGVFAIKDIPKGKNVFSGDTSKMIWIDKKIVEKQDKKLKNFIKTSV